MHHALLSAVGGLTRRFFILGMRHVKSTSAVEFVFRAIPEWTMEFDRTIF